MQLKCCRLVHTSLNSRHLIGPPTNQCCCAWGQARQHRRCSGVVWPAATCEAICIPSVRSSSVQGRDLQMNLARAHMAILNGARMPGTHTPEAAVDVHAVGARSPGRHKPDLAARQLRAGNANTHSHAQGRLRDRDREIDSSLARWTPWTWTEASPTRARTRVCGHTQHIATRWNCAAQPGRFQATPARVAAARCGHGTEPARVRRRAQQRPRHKSTNSCSPSPTHSDSLF